ncbi:MAG: TerC family protein [Bacteroidetes bacterium]|jgi:predicted tellurium resistance membrane protein TerC|nr:TerC family protein [Bacteroidota bacterium]
MEAIFSIDGIIALLTLTILEIVLGVDNIIFISIVSDKLPKDQQARARNIGLLLALVMRIGMLLGIGWIIGLEENIIGPYPLFADFTFALSGKGIILLLGGLFLIAKSTSEIHHKLEGASHTPQAQPSSKSPAQAVLSSTIGQIVLLDVIFSIDSILTAVGLTKEVPLMIIAVIISMIVMMLFAGKISAFINKHPSLQLLALSFLILIGFTLVLEALHQHVPKGYIYFAVCFSLVIEMLNMRLKKKTEPVKLHNRIEE